MENVKKFSTTTFGGFNKDDVSKYIDTIIAEHGEEVSSLRDELDDANDKINEFKKVVEQQYMKIVDANSQIERFVNENNELKARYTKMTSQFSMISDAKLEANRIVDEARLEAHNVMENAKAQLFELESRAKNMTQQSANNTVQMDNDAKEIARQTIDDAKKEQSKILAFAKKEADDTIAKAQQEAEDTISKAKEKAERTILRALEEAKSKDDEIIFIAKEKAKKEYDIAKEKASKILADAQVEADKIIADAQTQANNIKLIAVQQAEQTLADARKQAGVILSNTQKQADENVAIKEKEMLVEAEEKAKTIIEKAKDKLKSADLVILDAESKLERVLTTESDILDGANKKATEIIKKAKDDARQLTALANMESDEYSESKANHQADEIIKKAKTLSQKALDDTKKEIDLKLKALAEQEYKAERIVEDAKREADKILENARNVVESSESNNTPVDYELYENCLKQISVQRAKLLEILDEIKNVTTELPDYKKQDIQKEIYKTLDSNKSLNLVNSPKQQTSAPAPTPAPVETTTDNNDNFAKLVDFDQVVEVATEKETVTKVEPRTATDKGEVTVNTPHISVTNGSTINKDTSSPFRNNSTKETKTPIRAKAKATVRKS